MSWEWQIQTQTRINLLWRVPPKDIAKGRRERNKLNNRLNLVARKVSGSLQGALDDLANLGGREMTDAEFVAAVEAAGLSVTRKE